MRPKYKDAAAEGQHRLDTMTPYDDEDDDDDDEDLDEEDLDYDDAWFPGISREDE